MSSSYLEPHWGGWFLFFQLWALIAPVVPVCAFPCSHIPMVMGHCSVIGLQTICIPFIQSTISMCPAGLPQALSLATSLLTFFQAAWSYSDYVTRASLHSLSCLG